MRAPRFPAIIVTAFCAVALIAGTGSAELLGPTTYVQLSDSPFDGMTFDYFHVDDMEDGMLNTPGVTASVLTNRSCNRPGPESPDAQAASSVLAEARSNDLACSTVRYWR